MEAVMADNPAVPEIPVGTLIGPAAAGFAFDFAHSYLTPILTSAICNVIAAIVMAVVARARTRP
jgi:hypothetical protein